MQKKFVKICDECMTDKNCFDKNILKKIGKKKLKFNLGNQETVQNFF